MKHYYSLFFSLLLLLISNIAMANPIEIINSYVREIPPGQNVSASFMTLKNTSDKDISLIKVSGTIAKRIELHQHIHKDGMMQMRQVKKIIIPAQSSIELKPGGYHVMLIGLTKKIKKGDSTELKLLFNDDSHQTVKADVMSIMQVMEKQQSKEKDQPSPKH